MVKSSATSEFFDSLDRIIVGKNHPSHVVALRKTTDGSWVEIDSHSSFQKTINPITYFNNLLEQDEKITPCGSSLFFYGC